MNTFLLAVAVVCVGVAVFFAWHYRAVRKSLNQISSSIRQNQPFPPPASAEGEELISAIESLHTSFASQRAAMQAELERLATVLEQLTDGVLIANAEGRVQYTNPAAKRLFSENHPMGKSVAQVVRSHLLIEAWKRCQQSRQIQIETVEVATRKQYLQIIVIPDRHEGGSLLLAQDLTQVRKLETVRRDFISNVSHELRTPLASLKALTETLQGGAISDPVAGPRFLERIHTEVDALTQMTQELLDLSRIESGQVQLRYEDISPRKLAYSAAERMKAQAERANLKLNVQTDPDLRNIQADWGRLEQVLVNLVHNAVKFTPPGGEICLGVEAGPNEVRFAVRDSGIGIPADSLSRIFERFYRVDSSRAGGGTGLGLSISKHIVEAHGGQIGVESAESRGSTFFFTIPYVQASG